MSLHGWQDKQILIKTEVVERLTGKGAVAELNDWNALMTTQIAGLDADTKE